MPSPARHPIPAATVTAELVVSRSRFRCTLAHAATPEAARGVVRAVAAAAPDATHHCWAFVAGPPGSTGHVGMSDDGEPAGTAGRPMLTVLLHSGVGEIVAVVTRHYGGTKLGTGGLARAYAEAVQGALAVLPRRERVDEVERRVRVAWAQLAAARHAIAQAEGTVTAEDFDEAATLTVRVPSDREAALRRAVADATGGRAAVEP